MPAEPPYAARLLRPADYLELPWRNGRGTTTQIAIHPAGADFSKGRFLWRVSSAPVTEDGRFSYFPGYDRHLMLLTGAGMAIRHRWHFGRVLREPYDSHSFRGEWRTSARLLGGPATDFGVMALRSHARARLQAYRLGREPRVVPLLAGFHLFYAARGIGNAFLAHSADNLDVETGETLLLERSGSSNGTLALTSSTPGSVILGVSLFLNQEG